MRELAGNPLSKSQGVAKPITHCPGATRCGMLAALSPGWANLAGSSRAVGVAAAAGLRVSTVLIAHAGKHAADLVVTRPPGIGTVSFPPGMGATRGEHSHWCPGGCGDMGICCSGVPCRSCTGPEGCGDAASGCCTPLGMGEWDITCWAFDGDGEQYLTQVEACGGARKGDMRAEPTMFRAGVGMLRRTCCSAGAGREGAGLQARRADMGAATLATTSGGAWGPGATPPVETTGIGQAQVGTWEVEGTAVTRCGRGLAPGWAIGELHLGVYAYAEATARSGWYVGAWGGSCRSGVWNPCCRTALALPGAAGSGDRHRGRGEADGISIRCGRMARADIDLGIKSAGGCLMLPATARCRGCGWAPAGPASSATEPGTSAFGMADSPAHMTTTGSWRATSGSAGAPNAVGISPSANGKAGVLAFVPTPAARRCILMELTKFLMHSKSFWGTGGALQPR